MNPPENNVLLSAKNYVTEIFRTKISPSFYFHNLEHTYEVVKACSDMAAHYQLNENDRLSLMLAAWFHDTGYRGGFAAHHEDTSMEIAKAFMEQHNVAEPVMEATLGCISSTRFPQRPTTLPQQILCDADLFHLGTEGFFEKTKALRQEINLTTNQHLSKEEWALSNIKFLTSHRYFTEYCRQRLEPLKQEHLRKIQRKYSGGPEGIVAPAPAAGRAAHPSPVDESKIEPDKKEKKTRSERPDRGIETMFRTTATNHLKLSEMADSKANIMISVNSIILSIVISVLLAKLDNNPNFIIPTGLLLLMCVLTIIFAILATRPNVTRGRFTKDDIQNKKANLLFFGNFHQMSLEDYTWGMNELMGSREYLYGSMIKDIYFLGVVLARKYRYLRISYTIFMYGVIISVFAFIVASLFIPNGK